MHVSSGFSQRVTKLVQHFGSVYALNKITGVARATITEWMSTGPRRPQLGPIELFVKHTGVRREWLIEGKGEPGIALDRKTPSSNSGSPPTRITEQPGIYLSHDFSDGEEMFPQLQVVVPLTKVFAEQMNLPQIHRVIAEVHEADFLTEETRGRVIQTLADAVDEKAKQRATRPAGMPKETAAKR